MANRSMIQARSGNPAISNPELLQKNLRLLDLDEEFDWPGPTISTFAAADSVKNLNTRLYTAAWILYKLFDLFEPMTIKKELGDLFPPLDPKQSSLLRAAIFKRLYDMKLKGFFGKDVVVRKTMFDDCKGPKFEELLAVFSSAVLVRITSQDKTDRSIVGIGLGLANLGVDITCLNLAYKASLARQLRIREAYQRRLSKFAATLDVQRQALDQRAQQAQAEADSIEFKRISSRTLARLTRLLRENWEGDKEWVDVLISGDRYRPQGSLLETSYIKIWQHACNDTLYALRPQRNDSQLQILEQRVGKQKSRLNRWKNMHAAVVNRRASRQTEIEQQTAQPVKKYSLRSNSSTVAPPVQQTAAKPRMLQTLDDTAAPSQPAHRSKHSRSRSALPGIMPAKTPSMDQPTIAKKPVANTAVRLSSTSGMKRPVVQVQALEAFTDGRHRHGSEDYDDSAEEISDTFSQDVAADIVNSVLFAPPSAHEPPLTLAERTRMSMATGHTPQIQPPSQPVYHGSQYPILNPVPSTPILQLNDLAERTRQSMAIRDPASVQPVRQARSRPSSTIIYPVNQFETPRRPAGVMEGTFFDETVVDLDEADIFKSRPRVAVSPVLTPMLERGGVDSMMGFVIDDDGEEDDFS